MLGVAAIFPYIWCSFTVILLSIQNPVIQGFHFFHERTNKFYFYFICMDFFVFFWVLSRPLTEVFEIYNLLTFHSHQLLGLCNDSSSSTPSKHAQSNLKCVLDAIMPIKPESLPDCVTCCIMTFCFPVEFAAAVKPESTLFISFQICFLLGCSSPCSFKLSAWSKRFWVKMVGWFALLANWHAIVLNQCSK
jgi:hypothetical protein